MSAIADEEMVAELVTADANSWGFFRLCSGKILVIGFADLGLSPVAVQVGNRLFVGIDELVTSFHVNTFQRQFSYRMPTVFHEFVSLEDPIVVRDEIGFVGLSPDGEERWTFLMSGPISEFSIERGHVRGETIDREPFDFAIPN